MGQYDASAAGLDVLANVLLGLDRGRPFLRSQRLPHREATLARVVRNGEYKSRPIFLRRGMRIWPLYYVTLVLLTVIPGTRGTQWPDWIMVSNYFGTAYARSWSLSTEEQFYILVPLFLLAASRDSSTPALAIRDRRVTRSYADRAGTHSPQSVTR